MARKHRGHWRNKEHPYPAVKNSVSLSALLERLNKRKGLSKSDRLTIVEQALLLLEMNYVHLPLKRAMHAVDPIQRLKLIKGRLEEMKENEPTGEMDFHEEMQRIFTSTRDFHTTYRLPYPFNRKTAYLPFLIEEYFEEGDEEEPKFLVSKLAEGFHHLTFKLGVEILYWNGAPIKRAIEINGENQAGSNLEARFAAGLDSLTIRPLDSSLPPDEEWVVVTYCALDGQQLELKQGWWIFTHGRDDESKPQFIGERVTDLGIDIKKAAVNEARKILFAPEVVLAKKKKTRRRTSKARYKAVGNGMKTRVLETRMPDVLRALFIKTRRRKEFAYIRIFSFFVGDTDRFVKEFVRLLKLLPPHGLVLDVRNNGGGLINAGERLLQLLTPRRIKPELFELINTPLNVEICRHLPEDHELSKWKESLEQAVETGATYSLGFPLTTEESCNNIGQIYFGPVVLIIDALCYSTTDMLTAGFSDHEIGTVLGVSGNTGAGGASLEGHEDLRKLMRNQTNSPYRPLPKGVGMGVAFRRSIRVGDRAGGRPLEDLGVIPDKRHHMTRDDLLNSNRDLMKHAVGILAKKRAHPLSARTRYRSDGTLTVTGTTENISRLDVYINDRPRRSLDVRDGTTTFKVKVSRRGKLLLEGFDRAKKLVAVCRKAF